MTLPGLAVSAFHRIVRSVRLGRGGMVSVSGSAERHVPIRHSRRAFGCWSAVRLSFVTWYAPKCCEVTITDIYRQASGVPSTSATSLALSQAANAATSTTTIPTPPELEQTLGTLTSHRSVLGYLLLSRGQPVSIIRHSGVVFEGEHGRKYATAIGRMIDGVQSALEEVSGEANEGVCSPYFFPRVLRDR
jgi:dynein light chain roadblock-type